MYVVIVGAGSIGGSLADWLLAAEHEVVVIDRNASRCAAVEDRLGGISVVGDGTEASVLARAGVNRADIVIAATGRDDENMVACQLAKHRFGAARTISLVSVPEHEELFNLLGIDLTINTSHLVVDKIQEELSGIMVEEVGDLE